MTVTSIVITGAPATAPAHLVVPAEGSGPGLILLTDDTYSEDWTLQIAELMADEGYVTLVVDTRPSTADLKLAVALIAAAERTLAARPDVTGPIGLLGYGRGATIGYAAAVGGVIRCAVLYSPEFAADASELTRSAVPVMVHMGDATSADSPAAIMAGALRNDPQATLFSYPSVGPAFACEDSSDYLRPAAMMAYSRSLGLLRRVLGPSIDLEALWNEHLLYEFGTKDPDATINTMVEDCYVNHVPNMTGGGGRKYLHRFYKHHFIPRTPDVEMIPVSRTVGADRIVDEFVSIFTHDREIDWFLPGVPPTGKRVEVATVSIVCFRGRKLYHEHIYWDQASVLVQLGLLDPARLPVAGRESAQKVLDPTRPSNQLMPSWQNSEGRD